MPVPVSYAKDRNSDKRGTADIFMGYSKNKKDYKLLDDAIQEIVASEDVAFDEITTSISSSACPENSISFEITDVELQMDGRNYEEQNTSQITEVQGTGKVHNELDDIEPHEIKGFEQRIERTEV